SVMFDLIIGSASGGGTYTLSNGVLTAEVISVGFGSNATATSLSQSGGSVSTRGLNIPSSTGRRGVYTMTGGTLTPAHGDALGNAPGATGTLNQSGGTVIADTLDIGGHFAAAVATGIYNLSNGASLQVNTRAGIGQFGSIGSFTQTGGRSAFMGTFGGSLSS